MTIFIDPPRLATNATFAGGIASLADIAGAARDSLLYVENAYASSDVLQRVLDDRRKAIHDATGAQLADPMAAAQEEFRQKALERSIAPFSDRWSHDDRPETLEEIYDRHLTGFRDQLSGLAEKFPDAAGIIGADRNPWDDAAELARKTDERLGTLMASRSGLGKYGALLAGGMAGALADPITVMSLAAGGGPGAARTVAGRILSVAGKEAVINAATEAAIQPSVQAWRERVGLDHGLDEAIRNVLFAGAVGGVFGGGIGAAGEAITRAMRPADANRAAAELAANPQLSDAARAILSNDGLRAAETLAEIRAALPAEARGALDAAATVRLADDARPATARPASHDAALTEADRVIQMPDYASAWPGFRPDPVQIERVVRAIAGENATGTVASADTPLIDFLVERGGVADFKGELRAIGAAEISERFRGRLVKDSGESLDYAREAAAQAGFFDHLYGDAETAANRSTVADLLDVLEEEVRTRTSGSATSAEEAALGTLEGIVADIAAMAGPAVDDAVLARAARMAVEDGIEPFDALERVLIAEDLPETARPQRTGDPLPGWSDAELLTASEHRGAWPEPDGIDEPGRLLPEDADFEVELLNYDNAARIARAEQLGFTIEAFHGTNAVFSDFDPLHLGSNTGASSAKKGFFFAKSTSTAESYLNSGELIVLNDLGSVSPEDAAKLPPDVHRLINDAQHSHEQAMRASEAGDHAGYDHFMDASERFWQSAHSTASAYLSAGNNIRPVRLKMENPFVKDFGGQRYRDETYAELIDRAVRDGHDGVVLKNTFDGGDMDDIYVVFSPDQIRSSFDLFNDASTRRSGDELADLSDDLMIPTDDGMRSVAEIRAEIERTDNLVSLVEACKA